MQATAAHGQGIAVKSLNRCFCVSSRRRRRIGLQLLRAKPSKRRLLSFHRAFLILTGVESMPRVSSSSVIDHPTSCGTSAEKFPPAEQLFGTFEKPRPIFDKCYTVGLHASCREQPIRCRDIRWKREDFETKKKKKKIARDQLTFAGKRTSNSESRLHVPGSGRCGCFREIFQIVFQFCSR